MVRNKIKLFCFTLTTVELLIWDSRQQFKLNHDWSLSHILSAMNLDATQITDPDQLNIHFNQSIIECKSIGGAMAVQSILSTYKLDT